VFRSFKVDGPFWVNYQLFPLMTAQA